MGVEEYAPLLQEEGGADVIHPHLSLYVQRVGKRLAAVSDRPDLPYEFVVIDNTELNAWALPGGKIGINLGLLMRLSSEAELASVLAHEIAHAAAGHSATQVEREVLLGMMKAGMNEVLQSYWSDLGVSVGKRLVLLKYSRKDELEADAYGMKYMALAGYDMQGALAVEKMFLQLDEPKSQGWFSRLFATHPPSKERLKADRKAASKYGVGGFEGRAEYEGVIEPLRAKERAYRALDKGRRYLAKGKTKKALRSAQKGLSIEPNEPHLSLLEARALLHLGRVSSALTSINRAISINPNYYESYLERALVFEQQGKGAAAEKDRAIANVILPDVYTGQ